MYSHFVIYAQKKYNYVCEKLICPFTRVVNHGRVKNAVEKFSMRKIGNHQRVKNVNVLTYLAL